MALPRFAVHIDAGPGRAAPQVPSVALPFWLPLLAGLALFGLALAPRLVGFDQHLTADDQEWVRRVARFGQALQRGNLRDTYQSGHPGLPVLWLASLAFGPERSTALAGLAGNLAALEKSPHYLPALVDARRVLAIVSAGLIVLVAGLTWRLLGPEVGLLAGLLLAGEPFLVAHGPLLHTDPLLALLLAASILAALIYLEARGGWRFLVGSGLAAGLAISAKAPGIFLVGFVPLISLAWYVARRGRFSPASIAERRAPLGLARGLALWGLTAGAIFLLSWPALWVEPLATLQRLLLAVRGVGESPRRWGNFFLGQIYAEDVGPLFYLVATPLRLSPISLIGLLLLAVPPGARAAGEFGLARRASGWLTRADSHGPALLALTAAALLFTALMTISPKKLDRYLLPVFPLLVILAAAGWWRLLSRFAGAGFSSRPAASAGASSAGGHLAGCLARPQTGPAAGGGGRSGALRPYEAGLALIALVGLVQLLTVASVQPYPLSFFNPLLGGPSAARQAVIVGWGEGTDQVAAYLDGRPNASEIVVTSLYHDLIHPLFRGTGVPPWEWRQADYLAQYVNMDQRNLAPGPLQALVRETPPEFTVRINGLDYVRLYRIPPELKVQPDTTNTRGVTVPKP